MPMLRKYAAHTNAKRNGITPTNARIKRSPTINSNAYKKRNPCCHRRVRAPNIMRDMRLTKTSTPQTAPITKRMPHQSTRVITFMKTGKRARTKRSFITRNAGTATTVPAAPAAAPIRVTANGMAALAHWMMPWRIGRPWVSRLKRSAHASNDWRVRSAGVLCALPPQPRSPRQAGAMR